MNTHLPPDPDFIRLADYVTDYTIESELALTTARYCLMDAIGCAQLALNYPACTRVLGSVATPGVLVAQQDPVQTAFDLGTLIRWLDFNDTWLAAEWGHPSDNIGAILAVAEFVSRTQHELTMRTVLNAMIKAYEIQGILALENAFNRFGFDHVFLVKIASSALAMQLLGGQHEAIMRVLSQAFIDGPSLRTYRHAPNTGSRKSWAAGDATSRGVRLAWLTLRGEQGYPTALSTPKWGVQDVLLRGQSLKWPRALGSYVMENILFKIAYPAEFHAQTAVECALLLHPEVKNRLADIAEIKIDTQESAMRIINKKGPLYNPADRDHCMQYMVAVALLFGDLKAEYYEGEIAARPEIDALRAKMVVCENVQFSHDYLNPEKRSIANAVQIIFKDGTQTKKITIDYPLGHKNRRAAGIPLLTKKFSDNLATRFPAEKVAYSQILFSDQERLENMSVTEFMRKMVYSND